MQEASVNYIAGAAIGEWQDAQLQSDFFSRLPLELRRQVYRDIWANRICGQVRIR